MTVRWNANQPQALKRAFVMVNATEVIIIAGFVLAIRLGTRPIPIPVPDDTPVINIPYPDMHWSLPPPIDIQAQPTTQVTVEVLDPNAGIGITVPVPDPDATDLAGPTTGELNRALTPNPLLGPDPGITRVIPDTNVSGPPRDTEQPVIPSYKEFVRTTKPPEVVRAPEPDYPESCRLLGIENTAWVQMLLALDGTVMETRIAKTSGNAELDSAAVRAARRATFTPALGAHGKPVHVWVSMPYEFKLSK